MRTATRIVSIICATILMVSTFTASAHGNIFINNPNPESSGFSTQASEHMVSFYQVSRTPEGLVDPNGVSIAYRELTHFVPDGERAKNPGAVAYAEANPAMHFLGWYEFSAPDDSPYDFSQPLTRDLELFARFTSDCLVTFLNGFGESFLTKRVTPNTEISPPTAEEMNLFTAPTAMRFDDEGGWLQGESSFDFDTRVTTDITLSPSLASGATAYFVSTGSQVPFKTTNIGGTLSAPPVPTRSGYTFNHWSTTEGGSTAFSFDQPLTTDVTLYAVWTPQTVDYTVVVWMEKKNISGDAGTDSSNYEYFGKFTERALAGSSMATAVSGAASLVAASSVRPPTWSSLGFAEATSATVLGNGTTTLNVYYKRIVYNFSFTPYNNTSSTLAATANATMVIGGQTYTNTNRYGFQAKYEQDVASIWPVLPLAQLASPDKQLNFQGWRAPGVASVFVSKVTTISIDLLPTSGRNQLLTANWLTDGNWIDLNYMFETPDGMNMPGAVLYNGKYYAHDETYSQTVFSPGSAFALKEIRGMVALSSHALQKTARGFVTPTTVPLKEQYLFYDRNVFKISFDTQGGNAIADITGIHAGVPLAPKRPADPTPADPTSLWTFDGWYTSADYLTHFDFASETMPDTNVMLYAKWTRNPYTISVYDGLTNPSLLGTYLRTQGEYVGDPSAALAAAGINVDYEIGIAYPGKGEFRGWVILIGPGKRTPLTAELSVMDNVAIYADWSPQAFHITYRAGNAEGGTPPTDSNTYRRGVDARVLPPSDSANGGGSLVAPSGAVFTGWLDANGRIRYPGEPLFVDGDIALTARYTILDKFAVYTYHINFPTDAKDGDDTLITDPGNIRQYVGQGQEFPVLDYDAYSPLPEPVNYRFMGWAKTEATAKTGTTDYVGGERITAPVTINTRDDYEMWGVWVRYLPVTFDAGGAFGNLTDGGSSISFEVLQGKTLEDAGIAVPEVTVKQGYRFIGWALDNEMPTTTGNTVILTTPVIKSLLYKAVYTGISGPSPEGVEVVFDAGGVYGNLDTGATKVSYTVPKGGSLGGSNIISAVPEAKGNTGYTFTGWARAEDMPNPTGNAAILSATVTEPLLYKAVYSGEPQLSPEGIEVVFDAGGVYGKLADGTVSVGYTVPRDTSLKGSNIISIVPGVTPETGHTFVGWALDGEEPVTKLDEDILTTPVAKPLLYRAVYTGISGPSPEGIEVVFDAGGVYGNLDTGAIKVSYTVPKGGSLGGSGIISAVPGAEPKKTPEYNFLGWARDIEWPDLTDNAAILSALVTEPLLYKAVYVALPAGHADHFYTVTFDAGSYGEVTMNGTMKVGSTVDLSVKAGTALDDLPDFSIPSVTMNAGNPDIRFVGWTPVVDVFSPVNEVRRYVAQYAFTPNPMSDTFYSVRFEIGDYGTYKDVPVTEFMVREGERLKDLPSSAGFSLVQFERANITVAPNFEFIGWSPAVDTDTRIYASRIYRAQYAYMPQGISVVTLTPLVVVEITPGDDEVQVIGYDGYYDGAAHGIRHNLSASTLLRNVRPFWQDFAASAQGTTTWTPGLPPDEVNVINETVSLGFTATGKLPLTSEPIVQRSIIIRPRPLIPAATHLNLQVGDDIPLRASYGLDTSYDGKKQDGAPIGDTFDFLAHKTEFDTDVVPLSTTYQKGDPAGDYPIYAQAGLYGNYEIFEGTEGDWPSFTGWRLAGILHVTETSGGGGNNEPPPTPGTTTPATGDSSLPLIGTALFLAIVGSAFITLPRIRTRRTRRARS